MELSRWISGKRGTLPDIDLSSDFPKKYVVRIKGDDPRSGWIFCGMVTAEEMRDINEDGYWEWLDETAEALKSLSIEKERDELKAERDEYVKQEAIAFAEWINDTNWGEKDSWGKHDPPSIPTTEQLYNLFKSKP